MLNEVDSPHIKNLYTNIHTYYKFLFNLVMNREGSPYKDQSNITFSEFLWAFNLVSSRHIVMHGHDAMNDPNLVLILLPLMDLFNHSPRPNIGIYPEYNKVGEQSFLNAVALEDIAQDEQFTISYGPLSNYHLA